MKNKKIIGIIIFIILILIILGIGYLNKVKESEEEVREALSTAVHFYSCEEGGAAEPVVITKKFRMGILHNSSDLLSGSELSSLSGGGNFLGYKFYRLTDDGSTSRPVFVHVNSDDYITGMYVSVDEMDILTVWGVNYRVKHYLQNKNPPIINLEQFLLDCSFCYGTILSKVGVRRIERVDIIWK